MSASPQKRERLASLAESAGCTGALLSQPANFAWYTGGADNRVDHSDALGVASILVTSDSEYVLTNNIEGERMRSEQTPGFEVVEYPWYSDASAVLRELAEGGDLAADHTLEGTTDLSQDIAPLRYVLDAEDVSRYTEVGSDTRAALTEAASLVEPGMGETEAVALLVRASRRRGLFTPVAVAAGEKRALLYRHAIPSGEAPLGRRVTFGLCAERGGLYANITRTVHFEEPAPETARRFDACDRVLKGMRNATRPGRTLAEVFDTCRRLYKEVGYPEEWRLHHQGGMTGYATREVIAAPTTTQTVEAGQAYAWNPTVQGAKAEETFIVTEDGSLGV